MTSADDVNKMVLKFNPKIDFSDSPNGFFGGLRDYFDQLAKEEQMTCDWDGLEPIDYPTFGSKDDGADVIKPFYAVWGSFATKKSYAWKDKYRYSEAPDRRVRRLMEKENKKMREDGIREFNEAVRSLVAFVKKRDPRYQDHLQNEAQRQKSLRDSAAAQAARSRAANARQLQEFVVPEWMKPAEEEEEIIDEFVTESDEESADQFDCIVCDKVFKSEKQLEAHEKSKKHIKALKQLQKDMRKENKMMDHLDVEEVQEGQFTPAPEEERGEEIYNSANSDNIYEFVSNGNGEVAHDMSTPSNPQEGGKDSDEASEASEECSDYAPREIVEERLNSITSKTSNEDNPDVGEMQERFSATTLEAKETMDESAFQVGKAKQKRARRAAKMAAKKEVDTTCGVCSQQFESRTKLFQHIREEGHAQLKAIDPNSGARKGKKRR